MSDRLQKLQAAATSRQLRWSASEVKDRIGGILITIEEKPIEEGRVGQLGRIDTEFVLMDGKEQTNSYWSFWLNDTLKMEFVRQHVCIGDWIGIERRQSEPRKPRAYAVLVEKTEDSQPYRPLFSMFPTSFDVPKEDTGQVDTYNKEEILHQA